MLLTKSDTDDIRCERAIEFCRRCFANLQVERGTWRDPLPESVTNFDGDFLISYMSRWIVPGSVLERVRQASINFHPAPPEYPGVGCNNFALYDGAVQYGVTCHHMVSKVDAGTIIDVLRFPVYEWDDVDSLLTRTYDHLLVQFYNVVHCITSAEPLPTTSERWTREPYRRDELNRLCTITVDMSMEEVRRRVRATTFGPWRPTIEIAGHMFRLEREIPHPAAAPPAKVSGHGGDRAAEFNIMLSAAGRRVALMRLLQASRQELKLGGRVIATDVNRVSAAFHEADAHEIVPSYHDDQCLPQLLELCSRHRIRLIIPTIDPDLPFFAKHRERFEAIGTSIMVSSNETVSICNDKQTTHAWLAKMGFPTVRQVNPNIVLGNAEDWNFPVFVKPTHGSSSMGARAVRDKSELRDAIRGGDYIVQEIAPGHEYTVDVYVDRHGKCRCAVPRLRIETRGGEVTKAMTVRSEPIETLARRVAEALPGAAGVMNIQIFFEESTGQLNVSEINPRFGGGYPLTHQAGAPMTRWVLEELLGRSVTDRDAWIDGLVMLRYDDASFVQREQAGMAAPQPVSPGGVSGP